MSTDYSKRKLSVQYLYQPYKQYIRKFAGSLWRFIKNNQPLRSTQAKKKEKNIQKRADRKARQLEYHLMNLGFTERAKADLYKMIANDENPHFRRAAARVLARWYANQHNEECARLCLNMIDLAVEGETRPKRLRHAAIIAAECCDLLGDNTAARETLKQALARKKNSALLLAIANLEPQIPDRIKWINQALAITDLSPISYQASVNLPPFDCLQAGKPLPPYEGPPLETYPKVTVIMPAYNAESVIETALNSILAQTWRNLEIIVVDDCSTDKTVNVVKEYCRQDSRIRLIRAPVNRGPYVARNLALREATGTLVTCHDADDWSHPQKIEKQVLHLIKEPSVVGNTSEQVRVTTNLKFYRRGTHGWLLARNVSSFMFRRKPVLDNIGYWDCVRFSADNEFVKRVQKHFGQDAVADLKSGPLSLTRYHSGSLTGNELLGFAGFFTGARKQYMENQAYYHGSGNTLYYDFPQKTRPFPVPEPMWPEREVKNRESRHFDVIIASDFRLPGGTTSSNAEEIKAQKKLGLRTGLIQLSRYGFDSKLATNSKIMDLIDGDQVQTIVYGENVVCDSLIVKHPPVLQDRQQFVPKVTAKSINVIINQTPYINYGVDNSKVYDIVQCKSNLQEYFGHEGKWHPISPAIRETLRQYHFEELTSLDLADEDWVEIINLDDWGRMSRPPQGKRTRIGRHSRDNYFKWPDNPEDLLAVYPDEDKYEVHLMGGADTPVKTLGYLPKNWTVLPFGSESPKDFLSKLDVFVYFTHPDMVEAFGRVIIEAMAVGVPVILPPVFSDLFGEAAVYAETVAVKDRIDELMSNDQYYCSQVGKAHRYVEKYFGYQKHAERLRALSVSV